ncbi:decaprenyl-phosphate phosphoribosyltransferase [Acrocarpospora phusangensis]|uniref:Decaprenyl-phosphate phosphoribosyltransferase n=1 Tax=Acrocarpospora phusangensis TaxID=1070424 RepID=A0A919QAP7_9ACTN|nr:UbiA prenyltransferase family protein [Acrocarpospora phusangensis]GIH25178.1 decaprenyl-phosphate phosphoribosyltransferase [Acrocarpospora phusangensis]
MRVIEEPRQQARPGPVRDLIALVRPLHAAKSVLLVPLALLDTGSWSLASLGRVSWAVAGFVLAGACVYIGNDLADRHRDSLHPVKRHRPIASGRVPVRAAQLFQTALLVLLGLVIAVGPGRPYWPLLAYLALNVAYSRSLKHIPLIDVGTVALGFALRVVQGYAAIGEPISGWLVVTVFSLALLLVIGKRRRELLESGPDHRPALRGYSVELTGHLLQLTSVLAAVAGLIYLRTEAPFGPYGLAAMLLSTPFVLFALFRYLQVVLVDGGGGDPVRGVLQDRGLTVTGLALAVVLGATFVLARHPALAATLLR